MNVQKNTVNKVCISILNCQSGNNFKNEGVWFVAKSFCYDIFTNFQNVFGGSGGGGAEKSQEYHQQPDWDARVVSYAFTSTLREHGRII